MTRRRRSDTRFSTGRHRTPCRSCRRGTRTSWSGTASTAPRRADRAVATGPSAGPTPSWGARAPQRLAHRGRVLLVPGVAVERLRLRVRTAREDDDVRRAPFPRDPLEILDETRCDAETAGLRLDEEVRHLRVRRRIEGEGHTEARESAEATAAFRDHD